MKLIKKIPAAACWLIVSMFLLPACAATTMQRLAPGELTVKILADTQVEIVQTTARQEGKSLIVDGQLHRKKVHGRLIPKGHVDITIVDEQGKTIHKTFTRVSPEILPRMDGARSSFMAEIPVQAPPGSLVRVKFHSGPHDS